MKKKFLVIIFCCAMKCGVCIAQPGEWTWMSGSNQTQQAGHFGTKGVPSPDNHPPSLYESCTWTDKDGNFWLYGGSRTPLQFYSALWKYDVSTNVWTWIQGDSAGGTTVFGIKGIPDPSNTPGNRGFGTPSWTDTSGNFWLFGGYGGTSNADLWMYNISTNEWTWMNGSDTLFSIGHYGTKGIPDPANSPPSRRETTCSWVDSHNNLWLFGGQREGILAYEDLWRYNITTNEWTWISGSNVPNVDAHFGTKGIADTANHPGGRWIYARWIDTNDNLWLFGGWHTFQLITTPLNDLWKFDVLLNQWTWMSGSSSYSYDNGNYGAKCTLSTDFYPPSRLETPSCWNDGHDHFYLYGGQYDFGGVTCFGDLWVYDKASNKWAWISGDSSLQLFPVYGTMGVSSPNNSPGGRFGSESWRDNEDNLWLYGGFDIANYGVRADLWRYVPDPNCPLLSQINLSSTDTDICEKFCNNFFDQSTNNPTAWQWLFPGGIPSSSTDQNPTNICYDVPGTYDVTLITTNANGNDTLTLPDYITVYPTPSFPTISQVGYTLTSSPASSYQWQLNAVNIPGATNQSYNVLQTGLYTVIVSDSNGCVNSESQYVLISGIAEMSDATISIYPNPSSGNFIVELLNSVSSDEISIEVVNTLGQEVFSSLDKIYSPSFKKEIDLSSIAVGIYFIEIKGEHEFMRKKILISH